MGELSAELNSEQQRAAQLLAGVMQAARKTLLEKDGGAAGKALAAVCAEGWDIMRAFSAWRSEIGRRRLFESRFLRDAARRAHLAAHASLSAHGRFGSVFVPFSACECRWSACSLRDCSGYARRSALRCATRHSDVHSSRRSMRTYCLRRCGRGWISRFQTWSRTARGSYRHCPCLRLAAMAQSVTVWSS